MRIAHIIFAHKNPDQLERLINALNQPNFDIYIHIDKKIDIKPFVYLSTLSRVYLINNRKKCNWGGFGMIEAMISSIDQIQQSGIGYNFVNLLSGQDYPIKNADEIYDFFNQKIGHSFVSYDDSAETKWLKDATKRYRFYHFTDVNFKGKYILQNVVNTILGDRKFPKSLKMYGSNKSSWWTISYESAVYLSSYLKANRKLMRFFKFTWGSDEFVIATVLMNSVYKDKIINENYRYIDWSGGKAHPKILTIDDYDNLKKSDILFARKFDIKVDTDILDKIDRYITEEPNKV